MKQKVFKLIAAGIFAISLSANAANFTVQSFLNPGISSIVVSNGTMGWTNLNSISQAISQGLYQLGTNNAGTAYNIPITTNFCTRALYYSNATPVQWFGWTYPGSLVVYTNNTVAAATSTNNLLYITANTNNAINAFTDVNLPQDFYNGLVTDNGLPGAAGNTNSIGYLQVVSKPWSLNNFSVGAGSNQVTLIFTPIASTVAPQPGNGAPIAGYSAFLEPTEAAYGTSPSWTVTYTNQISTVEAQTVFNTPVPRWLFPGAKGMRLRSVNVGVATNAICVQSITLVGWNP